MAKNKSTERKWRTGTDGVRRSVRRARSVKPWVESWDSPAAEKAFTDALKKLEGKIQKALEALRPSAVYGQVARAVLWDFAEAATSDDEVYVYPGREPGEIKISYGGDDSSITPHSVAILVTVDNMVDELITYDDAKLLNAWAALLEAAASRARTAAASLQST